MDFIIRSLPFPFFVFVNVLKGFFVKDVPGSHSKGGWVVLGESAVHRKTS